MFDGVIIAPAKLLGSARNTNPINEQGHLPLSDVSVTIQDRFPDTIGKRSDMGSRRIHDYGTIVDFGHRLRERDTINQRVAHEMSRYNGVALPNTAAVPLLDGPVIQ